MPPDKDERAPRIADEKVTPTVYMAALLDEANEHLLEVKDLLQKQGILPKKSIPFNTGLQSIPVALLTQPTDPSGYTSIIDVYNLNQLHPVEKMKLINSGPGNIYFIVFDKSDASSDEEEFLAVGDSRPLYNVYKVSMRADLPFTQYRLVEGELDTGSFARLYKNYSENRIVLQPNEASLGLQILFDDPAFVGKTAGFVFPPAPQTTLFVTDNDYSIRSDPLPTYGSNGSTSLFLAVTLINLDYPDAISNLGLASIASSLPAPMPFTIPTGFIAEGFVFTSNFTTNVTIRSWAEIIVGSGVYTLLQTFPISARGSGFNEQLNLNYISTQTLDTTGAPPPGRKFIVTITNDDTNNKTIGLGFFDIILRKLS